MLLFQNKTTRAEIVKPAFLLLKFLVLNISIIIDFATYFPFIFVKIYCIVKILIQSFIFNSLSMTNLRHFFIPGVPGGKVNILGGYSIGHSKQKNLYEHVSYSELFPR